MTPRQREFCRHYLRGLSAPRAARAAGYSASTAEKNAATILSSEKVARHLDRQRAVGQLISIENLQEVRDTMLTLLREPDSKARALAGHALIRLYRMGPELAAQQNTPEDARGDDRHLLQKTTENAPQPLDGQQKGGSKKTNEIIEETDAFPTGEPAFDRRLAPIKPEIAKPITPVRVIFRGFTKPKPKKKPKAKPMPPVGAGCAGPPTAPATIPQIT